SSAGNGFPRYHEPNLPRGHSLLGSWGGPSRGVVGSVAWYGCAGSDGTPGQAGAWLPRGRYQAADRGQGTGSFRGFFRGGAGAGCDVSPGCGGGSGRDSG